MDTLTQENVVLSQNEPILPENPKKFNFLIILLSVLLFISTSIAVFFAYQTQKLVKELVILEKSSMPISTVEPIMTPDPTVDWKTYKYKDLFEIKIPQDLKINDRGYGHVEIGDFLTVGVYSSNPEDCRGDCSIIDTKASKEINNLETKYLTGWWGDIGGNVGQAYVSYVIPNNNQYVYLQMQELPFSVLTRPVREKVGSVNQENIKLLNQIISTFKFKDLETVNWKTYVDITNRFEIKYSSDWTTAKETKNKDSYTQIVDLAKTVESTFYNSDGKHALWISYIKNPNNLSLNQIIKSGMLDKNYGTLSTSFANEDVKFTELNIGNNKVYYPDINKWPSAFGIRSVFILNPSNNSYAWINLEPREDSSLDPIMDQIISTFEFTN